MRMPRRLDSDLDVAYREAVYGEDVQRLERHRVVAAEHVLVAQQIREVGRERAAQPEVFNAVDDAGAGLEPQELAGIEEVPEPLVTPAAQPRGFVPLGNRVLWHE